jgi:hypothetical protein
MASVKIVVRDYNTKRPISNASVSMGSASGITDTKGEVNFDASSGAFNIRVTSDKYSAVTTIQTVDETGGVITVDLVPLVNAL